MVSVKNLPAIFAKIVDGAAPKNFTQSHLKSIGFTSSNDQPIIPLLKDLGFLSAEGAPTKRYLDYRDRSRSKAVLADALRETYEDLFHINENPSDTDRQAIEGKFKATHNVSDEVASRQAMTFLALLKLADLKASTSSAKTGSDPAAIDEAKKPPEDLPPTGRPHVTRQLGGIRYNIEIHLPATKDPEVFNAIFKSLKAHLLDE